MSTKPVLQHESPLQFGAFRLDRHARVVDRAGTLLHLNGRARKLLTTLLEHAGETVAKRELMACVWPHSAVEEGTLRVHISALRRALGDRDPGGYYIENVAGHGYRFVAPVGQANETPQAPGLPIPLQGLVGHAGPISTLTERLCGRRLVTVVGPGGVGKTVVVLATADRLRESYPDGIWLVDMAKVEGPLSIKHSAAAALGIQTDSNDPLPTIIEYLRSRRALVVLDSCERAVEGVAIFADELLRDAPNLNIIATSREPLRANGEWLLRLGPLDLPTAPATLTAEQALQFPAIQLFVERAAAGSDNFQLHDADVAEVVEICRRLDGLPLAIELAGACVDMFGVRGLAAHLYERGVLTRGYRTAELRHQSLRATLEWSYATLTPLEQITLRRLAVFAAPFDLASATAVIADDTINAADVLDILASLTAKSLLETHVWGERSVYRLFETSRAFALDKLQCTQEITAITHRYAGLSASGSPWSTDPSTVSSNLPDRWRSPRTKRRSHPASSW